MGVLVSKNHPINDEEFDATALPDNQTDVVIIIDPKRHSDFSLFGGYYCHRTRTCIFYFQPFQPKNDFSVGPGF